MAAFEFIPGQAVQVWAPPTTTRPGDRVSGFIERIVPQGSDVYIYVRSKEYANLIVAKDEDVRPVDG